MINARSVISGGYFWMIRIGSSLSLWVWCCRHVKRHIASRRLGRGMNTGVNEPNQELFSPYGQVVIAPSEGPSLSNDTLDCWNRLAGLDGVDQLEITLCRVKLRPYLVEMMERHTQTYEVILPFNGDMVLPVADPIDGAGGVRADRVRLFRIYPGMCVVLDPGVWHWLPYPVDADRAEFFVVFRLGTADDDLITCDLDEAMEFHIP